MDQNWLDTVLLIFLMLLNAFAFIPQAIKIHRSKSAQGVSAYTYFVFLVIQGYVAFHSFYYNHDYVLTFGYLLSMAACSSVLIFLWNNRRGNQIVSSIEEEASEIFSQFPGHLYVKDLQGKTLWCNSYNWKDFGYSSLKDFVGKNDFDLFSKKDAEQLWKTDHNVMTLGKLVIAEESFSEKGKTKLYLSLKAPLKNAQGKIIGLVGTSVDITNAKKEVSEQLALLDNVIAAMPGNVYWMNRDGMYLGCNEHQRSVLGLSARKEIAGKRSTDFQNHAFPEIIDVTNEEIMAKGVEVTLEEPAKAADNSIAIFTSSKVPLRDSIGNVVGLLGISIDITEKKKAEQELMRAKEAAEAANRAKTEFLANMSHDVKTPLSGVIGMADLMMRDFSGQDHQRAEAIYSCGMQLLGFFNSCLDLSKLEMQEWASTEEVFSLAVLLKEISSLLFPSAQMKGLELTVKVDPALPAAVRAHRASVYRVMLNLVGNALKFTPRGAIHVRAFLLETMSPIQVRVGLEVKDTGIGIPADQQGIIFEKMRRLTPAYEGKIEGSGIGLYIVDQYVKRMGGSIQVDSVVGEGSTFTVLLPMTVASEHDLRDQEDVEDFFPSYIVPPVIASEKVERSAERKYELPENAPHILLVEDNPLIQQVTQAMLNGAGFSVDVAGTGAEAIEKFLPEKYRLVYMDIGLPDQDGYSVTQAIRAKEAQLNAFAVPIIALTAHGAVDVETFCGRVGMQGVLSKPLTREQASAVWKKFGLGRPEKIPGLTVIGHSDVAPLVEKIIDMSGTIDLLGSKEYAEELLALWYEMLSKRFLPALKDLVDKRDDEGLRHELHNMLGSLCYVKTPLLNQAVLELQTAARDHPQGIEEAYRQVLAEAQRFIEQYQQQFPANKL